MPRADMLPFFTTEISEVPSTTHPLGMRPAGEGGTTPALGVVINAIVDALSEFGVDAHRDAGDAGAHLARASTASRSARGWRRTNSSASASGGSSIRKSFPVVIPRHGRLVERTSWWTWIEDAAAADGPQPCGSRLGDFDFRSSALRKFSGRRGICRGREAYWRQNLMVPNVAILIDRLEPGGRSRASASCRRKKVRRPVSVSGAPILVTSWAFAEKPYRGNRPRHSQNCESVPRYPEPPTRQIGFISTNVLGALRNPRFPMAGH